MRLPAMRFGFSCLLAAALTFVSAPSATAATRTFTLRSGPVAMAAFNVALPSGPVPVPGRSGYIVGMTADLVDAHAQRVTIRDVMLHHVVFFRRRRESAPSACSGVKQETFYGTGEERQSLQLPPGYGYRIGRHDRWRAKAMLMSHSMRAIRVYIRYRVTVATHVKLTPVRPFWVRANGCGRHVTFPITGDGGPGSSTRSEYLWRVPLDGRIVAVGGHLHGGAQEMWLSQPRCGGRELLDTAPRYGMPDNLYYRVRPILHEPGPTDTRYFLSATGIPVHRGERLRLTATYDNAQPHPRVMAIMHIYIAPALQRSRGCPPLPADGQELVKPGPVRTEPPQVHVPLTGLAPTGHTYTIQSRPQDAVPLASGATVELRNLRFTPWHISLPAGAALTWRFADPIAHDVLFANGPRVMGSPTRLGGRTFTTTFTVPGHYEMFCYLHPLTMHQIVEVLPTSTPGAEPNTPLRE
jgi:plastocyanin